MLGRQIQQHSLRLGSETHGPQAFSLKDEKVNILSCLGHLGSVLHLSLSPSVTTLSFYLFTGEVGGGGEGERET